jgi:ATPase subunit of ABC transporter with duplicated ATPase domains
MSSPVGSELGARLERVGRRLAEREADHAQGLAEARACAEKLRARVEAALARFHASASAAGAPHLRIELGEVRVDDKHLRSVQFDLNRGRHRAIVTAKSRGDVTLVGPFRAGKQEGPCRTFPMDAGPELESALGEFLERFAEAAATP